MAHQVVPSNADSSDDENQLPSYRSSVNVSNPDNRLIQKSEYLKILPNNHVLDFHMKSEHPVILEILKGHPLRTALSKSSTVPLLYLQQFWKTIAFHPEEDNHHFTATIDNFETRLTLNRFRRLLGLPKPTSFPGRTEFQDLPTEEELCGDVISLGYTDILVKASAFKRMHLPQIWYTLFSIINRCLTSKHTGVDKCSISVLRMFHGVAFNRHIDYAVLLWNELVEVVADKTKPTKARQFIPFQRFLQIMVDSMMRGNPDIPRRESSEVGPSYCMHYLRESPMQFPFVQHISLELLAYADQQAECVVRYKRENALLAQPEPVGPTQSASHAVSLSEDRFIDEQGQELGVSDQGEQRENLERGEVGSPAGPAHIPNILTDLVQLYASEESDAEANVDATVADNSSDSDDEYDDANSDNDDDPNDDAVVDPSSKIPRHIGLRPTQSTDIFQESEDEDQSEEESDGDIRSSEGVLVENVEVSMSDGTQKEYGESETRLTENVDLNQTVTSRVATSTIMTHSLRSDIEQDVVDPATQLHTLPSHSTTSQQVVVSLSHGDLSQNLFSSYLGSLNIESEFSLPPFSQFFNAPLEFEPDSFLGTHDIGASVAQPAILCESAGTPREESLSDILQGPGGNPTSANVMPTLNVGHTVYSTVMSTGSLSDPGVSLPEFVSREYLNGALKAVQDSFTAELASVKSLLKGKSKVTEDPPPTPSSEPQRQQSDDLSVEELQNLLYAKLLSRSNLDSEQSDLMGMLRQISEQQQSTIPATSSDLESLKTEFIKFQQSVNSDLTIFQKAVITGLSSLSTTLNNSATALQQSFNVMSDRLKSLEQTCRSQATSSKRKHDDQDDPDQHEGERKRQRVVEISETVQVSEAEIPEGTESGIEGSGSGRQVVLYVNPDVEPRVEKPKVSEAELHQITSHYIESVDISSDSDKADEGDFVWKVKESLEDLMSDTDSEGLYEGLANIPLFEPQTATQSEPHTQTPTSPFVEASFQPTPPVQPTNQQEQAGPSLSKPIPTLAERQTEIKWQRVRVRTAYLEDDHRELFVHNIRELDEEKVLGIRKQNKAYRDEYKYLLKAKSKPRSQVYSDQRIVAVKSVIARKFYHLWYPVFDVMRQDGRDWNFSEADFSNLRLEDFEFMYHQFRDMTIRPEGFVIALEAIKRFLHRQVKLAYIIDLQIAVESNQRRVNLRKPNQDLEDVDAYPLFMILEDPEFGVIYRNQEGQKKFLRFAEIACYSDGTLKLIRRKLSQKLQDDLKAAESDRLGFNDRNLISRAIIAIDNRIEHRLILRRLETLLGLRAYRRRFVKA